MSTQIVLASGNRGKLAELGELLGPLSLELVGQSELGIAGAEETGLSFVENAILKARHAAQESGLPALADDSGLEVDALNGAPGIYSARFAGPDAKDSDNNAKLATKLAALPAPYLARFHCVVAVVRHAKDPTPLICQGTWEGEIRLTAQGSNGFGYDPHFWLADLGKTAAELNREEKNRLSHRAQALASLQSQLPGFLNITSN